ncbi:flagellar biosynthesis protein FlhF [Bacillus sp. FJAT-42315]|uniref:flagellar biosynthesis protein FlhF n=1 Tax=Bacillus sp. FJAT-42315 TaxID=2014077 RepID=UPI000C233519|nr:flagellar biosynthesis protein FlhF [Bacillus sp. FJAT-42315]
MKVKKYQASSMQEAMKKIRADLGKQAVILQSKTVYTGGFFGLFKKKAIEVVAGVDPNPRPEVKEKSRIVPMIEKTQPAVTPINNAEVLAKEVKELKKILEQYSRNNKISLEGVPEELKSPLVTLKEQEVSNDLIMELKQALLSKWKDSKGHVDQREALIWAKEWLLNKIKPLQEKTSQKKKYINIVGPTGVGKTTTLAKMAADSVLEKGKEIAFISTDTYRIAAINQLKTYADLLKVPMHVVYKAEDFTEAIKQLEDHDMIYIDTAGRNYRDERYVKELKSMISFEEEVESYLVMALTSKENDLKEIIDKFSLIPIEKFIFTKMDETKTHGTLLNLMCHFQKGVAFITNGQNVPDDLMEVDAETIVDIMFGENV